MADENDIEENVFEDEELEIVDRVFATPLEEDNKTILKRVSIKEHEQAFHRLFLELLDFGKAYDKAKQDFTKALLNTGSRENPQAIYEYIDTLSSRLEKIHIVKQLCAVLGLQGEMEQIIEYEMDRIYKAPQKRESSTANYGSTVAGDIRNDTK